MSTFVPPTTTVGPLDPLKHVNYTLGMLLGEEDFKQEFAYLSGRDQWMVRGVLGYGTFCGLQVSAQPGDSVSGYEIRVEEGAAINPRGQIIRVPSCQRAELNPWLNAHRSEVLARVGSPPGYAQLYVVLCYRECEIDPVLIPGEPCRSEDDTRKPSRVLDDYRLELSWDAPDQRQEDAVRWFVSWLRQIPVLDDADTGANYDAFTSGILATVPEAGSPPESPPSPPEPGLTSPPAGVFIPRESIDRYLRQAFMLWTTVLRPHWLGDQETCSGQPPREDCVLLAEIHIPLASNGLVSDTEDVVVLQDKRPFLLSLRMVQEWLLHGSGEASPAAVTLSGDVSGASTSTTVVGIQDFPVNLAGTPVEDGTYLQFTGGEWVLADPRAAFPKVVAAGRFDADGAISGSYDFSFNSLQLRRVNDTVSRRTYTYYFMRFDGYDGTLKNHYVVKAMVITDPTAVAKNVELTNFNVVAPTTSLMTEIDDFNRGRDPDDQIDLADLVIRVSAAMPIPGNAPYGISIEISQYS